MSEPQTRRFECPHCQKGISYSPLLAGKTGKCPNCRDRITLPGARIDPGPSTQVVQPPALPASNAVPSVVNASPPAQRQAIITAADTEMVERFQSTDSRLTRFLSDGQPVKTVGKLLDRVEALCTSTEVPEYIAVQTLPISPDAIVLTNRRVIIFRAKALGRMQMVDVSWLRVQDIHIREGMVHASLSVTDMDGMIHTIDYLPKPQARHIYRIGQEKEENAIEQRRNRKMEEDRNAAMQVNVQNVIPVAQSPMVTSGGDLTSRLSQLKQMLDAGLISDSEFDQKKAEILACL